LKLIHLHEHYVDNIKALGAWAGIQGKPNQITNEEIANGNINDIRFFSPNDVKGRCNWYISYFKD
jgi:hypothetical protein